MLELSDLVSQLDEFRTVLWDGTLNIWRSKEVTLDGKTSKHEYLDFQQYLHCLRILIWSPLVPTILIRREYVDAYDALVEDASNRRASARIVTGQSGIGKTLFLFYVLVRRLQAQQPVAIETTPDKYFLFTAQGVTVERKSGCLNFWDSPLRVWALSNSGDDLEQPSIEYRCAIPGKPYVVQAIAPRARLWRQWAKERKARLYVMDVWPEDELLALGSLIDIADPAELVSAARKWGPSPRNIIHICKGILEPDDLQARLEQQATTMTNDPPSVLLDLKNAADRTSDVVFVRPFRQPDGGLGRTLFTAWIPSEHICWIIATALRKADVANQAKFFSLMGDYGHSRSASGWLFEAWVHTRLLTGSPIPCHWVPSPTTTDNNPLPTLEQKDIIAGPPSILQRCSIFKPFYWQSSGDSFPGIDSVLFDAQGIYVIQSTISLPHRSAELGLEKLKASLPSDFTTLPWNLVFAAPDEYTCGCLLRSVTLPPELLHVSIGTCAISVSAADSLVVRPQRPYPDLKVN